jgi:DNA repair protein RAD57
MAQRSSELVKLGQLLRDLAREQNIAIVVANQVTDRFSSVRGARRSGGGTLPLSSIAGAMSSAPGAGGAGGDMGTVFKTTMDPMSLDHQQRWFTGWGDDPHPSYVAIRNLKTPSLGVIWTTQIACRIALIKRPVYGPRLVADEENEGGEPVLRKWRRWMKVVFAPHVAPSGPGLQCTVEFQIRGEGMRAVKKKEKDSDEANEQVVPPS